MRKLTRLLLLPLIFLFCTGVSAAQIGNREIDVHVKFKTTSVTPVSYSVDITWTDMTFTYTKEDTRIWDPANHSYQTRSRTGWDRTQGTVTVTNHSNVDVHVAVSYVPVENTGVKGTLKNATGNLKAGTVGDYAGADSMTTTLTVSGTPTGIGSESETKVGSLTVIID